MLALLRAKKNYKHRLLSFIAGKSRPIIETFVFINHYLKKQVYYKKYLSKVNLRSFFCDSYDTSLNFLK